MIFTSDNIDDIRRYYRNTYVKFRDLGETICYIGDIQLKVIEGESVYCVTGKTSTGDLLTIPLWPEQPFEVEYVLPKKAFFLYNNKLHQLRRIPARQYSRGICSENTSVVSYNSSGSATGVEITAELLQAYVDKPNIKIPSATDLSKQQPILLSRRIALVGTPKIVMVDLWNVGKCRDKTVYVKPLFYPELSSLLKGTDIQVEARE